VPAQLLRLRHRLLASQARWDELVALLPTLRRHKVFADARLAEMEAELAARRLTLPMLTLADAQQIWRALSKSAREQAAVQLAYARALLRLEAGDEAETLLRKALGRHWDPRLVALYGELEGASPAVLLGRAEAWLTTHADDTQLLLALGRLGFRAGLWGKARAYLEEAIARHPTALTHRLLADVYDRLDEPALAQRQRALGLELATAGASAFLPSP
jgi:HemY protein